MDSKNKLMLIIEYVVDADPPIPILRKGYDHKHVVSHDSFDKTLIKNVNDVSHLENAHHVKGNF